MKKILFFLCVVFTFSQCDDGVQYSCSTYATLKDLTGLDGCGFVFELDNGTRLEPLMLLYCGTPPIPKEITEDPLYGFEFVHGKRVRIGYKEVESASTCMVGPVVKIICIEEVSEQPEED